LFLRIFSRMIAFNILKNDYFSLDITDL